MRFFVVILMLVLLPLRGWMGDAMATGMAAGAVHTVSASAQEQTSDGHFEHLEVDTRPVARAMTDCAGHTAAPMSEAFPAGQVSSDPTDQNGHGDHCQTCQACHSVAMSSSALPKSSSFSAPSQPQALSAPFTSAFAALSQKPPIS